MATTTTNDVDILPPSIEYYSGKTMMQHGSAALHEHVTTRVEAAMGKSLPQMEVRVTNLTVSATVPNTSSKSKAEGKTTTKHLLRNFSGVFKPGRVTLVLDQPGSGKSTLMKVLSGRFPVSKTVALEGEVTYNGTRREELLKRLPQFVSYVTQRDNHFPMLSVKETLAFAHECCGGELSARDERHFVNGTPEENKAALDAARALYKHYPEVVIHQLGLDNCQDTIVGDAMVRGVSGGERKRVTTGEMQFGDKFVTFMDEISTGLDSAATYDIIQTQRSIATTLRKTVVIALLQPSPEVVALFDDVLILNKGHVMFHGPRESVMPYFESLGFHCPPHRDDADFLMDLGTQQQHQYEVPRIGDATYKHPRHAREFAEIFERSAIHAAMLTQLHAPHDPARLMDNDHHFASMPEFHQSFLASTLTLVERQLKVTLRNTAFIYGRGVMVVVIALVYSALFWQFDVKNAQVVLGLLFQSIMFIGLGQFSQIPIYMGARPMFYKQRGANFFRTSSYVLACSVAQIPLAALEAIVYGSIVYWMCGFDSSVVSFVLFEVLLFLTNLVFAAIFFLLCAASPDENIAQGSSMMMVIFTIVFGGFVVPKSQIPGFLVWIYWANPVSWCLRALAITEYRRDGLDVDVYDGITYKATFGKQMGEYSLGLYDIQADKQWLGLGIAFMVASFVFFMAMAYFVLEYVRFESPENVTGDENDASDKSQALTGGDSGTGSEYALVETPRQLDDRAMVMLEMPTPVSRDRMVHPVTLAFQDLKYSVPDPNNAKQELMLLNGISGFAKPGSITALMGSSGAGKTTLMDVIAGRKTGGTIQGQILLNGFPATDLSIRRSAGYCEQMDVHSQASTFREALTFSAFLRQGADVPDAVKFDSVDECLDLLDLRPIADQMIRGSSVEQMKRLTIGVELAAHPSILFLDEPTSGLDARSAKMVMDGVRKVADSGRTVVCTIHQPSWEVFQLFDSLLLLKRGGETVYFGEVGQEARDLVSYFESIDGTMPLEQGTNPASWMLEVIGAGVGNAVDTDFVKIFNASAKKQALAHALAQDGVTRPAVGASALAYGTKRASSEIVQAKFLITRFMAVYWRTPTYHIARFGVYLTLAFVFGLCYVDADYTTYQGINGGQGMLYMACVYLGVVSFNAVMPIAEAERAAFYRERAAQTYSTLWYVVGACLAEIPYVFVGTLLFTSVFFPLVGFTGVVRFLWFWFVISLHVLVQTFTGQWLIYSLPSVEVASIAGVMLNSILFMFMGFNPPAATIPSAFKWVYHITPQQYPLAILSATVFGDCVDGADLSELACKTISDLPPTLPSQLTVKQFVETVFLMKHDEMWTNFGINLAFMALFCVLSLLSLRFINHQKR